MLIYCCFGFTGKLHICICHCDYPPLCFITWPFQPFRLGLGFISKVLTCYPCPLSLWSHPITSLKHKKYQTRQSPFFLWFFMHHSFSYTQPQYFTKIFLQECLLIVILYGFDWLLFRNKCIVSICFAQISVIKCCFVQLLAYISPVSSLYLKWCSRKLFFSERNSVSLYLLILLVECRHERETLRGKLLL